MYSIEWVVDGDELLLDCDLFGKGGEGRRGESLNLFILGACSMMDVGLLLWIYPYIIIIIII